jgi:hypothetical protein
LRFRDRWNVVCICRIESQRTIQERKIEDIITQKNSEHKSYVDILESDYVTCKVSSCTFSSLKFIFSNITHVCVWTFAMWNIVCVCLCECWLPEEIEHDQKVELYLWVNGS